MKKRQSFISVTGALFAFVVIFWGADQGWAQSQGNNKQLNYKGKVTYAEKKAAAKRARALGLTPGVPAAVTVAPENNNNLK